MDSIDNSIKFQGQFDMSRNANDIQGLDKLRRAAQSGDDAALQEAAKQFEAIFVQMMLKSMRKAQDVMADKDSPFNSEQVKFYRDMHDQQLATDMSNNGSIGLADIIVKQLSKGGNGFTPSSVIRNDANLSDINRHSAQSIEQAQQLVLPESVSSNAGYKDAAFRDQNEFLDTLYPVAQQVAKELGIDPKALLAQAAVETGWGQYMMHTDKGNTHNLFGIKAGNGWQGDTANVSTIEFEQGLAAPKKAKFRAYNSSLIRLAELTGMAPTKIEAAEISQAFSTGAVESMITSPTTGKNSKIWENGVKYFYDIAAWYPKNMIIVNKDAWNKLDSATQKLVMSEAAKAEKKGWALSKKGNKADKKALADAGMKVGKVNSALNKHFKEVGATMSKEWAGRAGSRGQAVLAAY